MPDDDGPSDRVLGGVCIPLADVVPLPVQHRQPPAENGPMLQAVPMFGRCSHFNTQFEVDVDAAKCLCLGCGAEVSPMFVLEALMRQESRWMQTRAAYQDEMKRLSERERTKCQHCGKITRISHR
jgi:hypothetical protein